MKYTSVQSELFRRLTAAAGSAVEAVYSLIEDSRGDAEIHAKIVGSLLSLSVAEDEARTMLAGIVDHHRELGERLGRPVDIRVAAMDYATRHPELITDPVVVSLPTLSLSQRLAAVDELTGLFNRRFLDLYLAKELNRARRYQQTFSVVFLDLDNFKSINDGYGHDAGDEVLASLAREVQSLLRKEDFAARYGGEEFVVVLPHTDTDGARRFAERLSSRLAAVTFPAGIRVTYSGGIATFPLHGVSERELIHNADSALYQAKLNGKAHVRVAVPDKRSSPRHVADLQALCFVGNEELGEVKLHDISRAGVSVQAETLLAPGQTIRFRITPPGETAIEGQVEAIAKVVWSRKVDELQYRFGGRWASADADVVDSLIERVASE
ncbi:MAG: GGDEF domain-containing protein [Spirochaetota bacterium]